MPFFHFLVRMLVSFLALFVIVEKKPTTKLSVWRDYTYYYFFILGMKFQIWMEYHYFFAGCLCTIMQSEGKYTFTPV